MKRGTMVQMLETWEQFLSERIQLKLDMNMRYMDKSSAQFRWSCMLSPTNIVNFSRRISISDMYMEKGLLEAVQLFETNMFLSYSLHLFFCGVGNSI